MTFLEDKARRRAEEDRMLAESARGLIEQFEELFDAALAEGDTKNALVYLKEIRAARAIIE